MSRLAVLLGVVASFVLFVPQPAAAQISPGPLSEPHAQLEGAAHCLDCHAPGEGVSAARCLDCHSLLAARVAAGAGFHAQPDLGSCESCHVEHHGREFELVWWGEEGIEAFDHERTGFSLEGGHRKLACRDCHRATLLVAPGEIAAADKDPARTFLGLGTACLDCHVDNHEGRFAPRGCLECHDTAAWKPVKEFDHDLARFRLTGLHSRVACAECHPREVDDQGQERLRLTGIAFERCTDCHRDAHDGRLGATCAQCHDTGGWRRRDRTSFDHERTRYPLSGAHVRVGCAECHDFDPFRSPRTFAACRDCHVDAHVGQFAKRADGGACEACHTDDRFLPSTFGLADHERTSWPLEGAHLAVPCVACHEPLAAQEARNLARRAAADPLRLPPRIVNFHPAFEGCPACHGDPHRGEVDRFVAETGCETCHTVRQWSPVAFDHDRADFELRGAHTSVACAECHPPLPARPPGESPPAQTSLAAELQMRGLGKTCADCHEDPHRGQLAVASRTDCRRCHGEAAWRPVELDHDRETRFSLEGAHARVPCADCHTEETDPSGQRFVRYKPLPTECEACHGPVLPARRPTRG